MDLTRQTASQWINELFNPQEEKVTETHLGSFRIEFEVDKNGNCNVTKFLNDWMDEI